MTRLRFWIAVLIAARSHPHHEASDRHEDMLSLILGIFLFDMHRRVPPRDANGIQRDVGTLEELFIVYRQIAKRLADLGVRIVAPLVGRYATSMEMSGLSITFCKLDEELERLLKAPCDCPFLKV